MEYLLEQLLNGVLLGATYSLVAVGFTLIFGIMKVLNIAHAEMLMLAAVVSALAVRVLHLPIVAAFTLGVGTAVLAAFLIERLVLRPLLDPRRDVELLAPLIATFGVSTLLANTVTAFLTSQRQFFPAELPRPMWEVSGVFISGLHLVTFLVAVAMMLGLQLWIERTRLGKAIRAAAENAEVAGAFGVNVSSIVRLTMLLSGALGGIAGLMLATQFGSYSPFMGLQFGLKGLVVMIIGGVGSLTGAMVAGLLLGAVEALAIAYLSSAFAPVAAFGTLIVFLLVRPTGLFGRAARVR